MRGDLHLTLGHHRGVPVLTIAGELDLYSALQLRTRGRELIDEAFAGPSMTVVPAERESAAALAPRTLQDAEGPSTVLVMDFAAVPFVDSAGLGGIVEILKRVRSHRAGLSISGANPQLRHILDVMGLTKVIVLHASVQEAVQDVRGNPPEGGTPTGT